MQMKVSPSAGGNKAYTKKNQETVEDFLRCTSIII